MGDGIEWLADQDDWSHTVFFARGVTPEELGARLGGLPASVPPPLTGQEAWDRVMDLGTDEETVARVGSEAGWAFAVLYGFEDGGDRLQDIARGAEAIQLVPAWDHPPARFSYAEDGTLACSFGIGEEAWRVGERPDLLLPELVDAGVLHPDGTYAGPDGSDHRVRVRNTLAVIQRRFGVSLSRDDVERSRLPAFVISSGRLP
ncbi:DUF6461 domain-containing protein [Streptomyces sp. NPDC002643]